MRPKRDVSLCNQCDVNYANENMPQSPSDLAAAALLLMTSSQQSTRSTLHADEGCSQKHPTKINQFCEKYSTRPLIQKRLQSTVCNSSTMT